MLVFSVEPGKKFTKYACINEKGEIIVDKFETRYTKLDDFNSVQVDDNSFLIELGQERIIVGPQGQMDALSERTKKTELHKYATFTAISNMLEKLGREDEEIILVTSIPGTSYKSAQLKAEYISYYMEEPKIEIINNGKIYKFELKDVILQPETIGFYFRYPQLCCTGKKTIVDMGGFNIGLLVVENGSIVINTSLDYGGIDLENIAIEMLEARYDSGVDRRHIYTYLRDGYVTKWGEEVEGSGEIISRAKKMYLDESIKLAAKKKVYLQDMDTVHFIGGTSQTLNDAIGFHDQLSRIGGVMKDAMYISVMGNLLYALKKHGMRSNGQV